MLRDIHPYFQDFVQICEMSPQSLLDAKFVINPEARPANEHRRVHNLNLHKVSVLTSEIPSNNDLVVEYRTGGLRVVSDLQRSFDPLHFVLLFQWGTDGWHVKLFQKWVA